MLNVIQPLQGMSYRPHCVTSQSAVIMRPTDVRTPFVTSQHRPIETRIVCVTSRPPIDASNTCAKSRKNSGVARILSKSSERFCETSSPVRRGHSPEPVRQKSRKTSRSEERHRFMSMLNCAALSARTPRSPAYGSTPFDFPSASNTHITSTDIHSGVTNGEIYDANGCEGPRAKLHREDCDGAVNGKNSFMNKHAENSPVSGDRQTCRKPPLWKSISTFSLRSLSFRSRTSSLIRNRDSDDSATESGSIGGGTMERSRSRLGSSVPGDVNGSLACTDESKSDRSGSTTSDTTSTNRTKSTEDVLSGYFEKAEIIYGTLRRRSSGRFSSAGIVSVTDSKPPIPRVRRGSRSSRKQQIVACEAQCADTSIGYHVVPRGFPASHSAARLVRVLKLDNFLMNRWITGLAVTDRNDLVAVDLRAAYLIDLGGNLIRTIGTKGSHRLVEPICVTTASRTSCLAFSDNSDQSVKTFTTKGVHVRTESELLMKNIAGIAFGESSDEIFIAGTDRKNIIVYRTDGSKPEVIPSNRHSAPSFRHPYSIAYNSVTDEIIVGDDSCQTVTAVSRRERRQTWQFKPPTSPPDEPVESTRQFFPSSICTDENGCVFIADLYNEKVYMLDSSGQYLRTLLSRGDGLRGNPGAMATDRQGHLYISDEEKTIKVFQYHCRDAEPTTPVVNQRFSYVHDSMQY